MSWVPQIECKNYGEGNDAIYDGQGNSSHDMAWSTLLTPQGFSGVLNVVQVCKHGPSKRRKVATAQQEDDDFVDPCAVDRQLDT